MIIITHIHVVYLKLLLCVWGGGVLCFHYAKSSMSGFHCQRKDFLSQFVSLLVS